MNREFALAAADYVERVDPLHFDMEWWEREEDCGTVACLAGHICHFGVIEGRCQRLGGVLYRINGVQMPVECCAVELLGADPDAAEDLFSPFIEDSSCAEKNWSPEEAAQALRDFVEKHDPQTRCSKRADAHRAPESDANSSSDLYHEEGGLRPGETILESLKGQVTI